MSARMIAGLATVCVVGVGLLSAVGLASVPTGAGQQLLPVSAAEAVCPATSVGKGQTSYLAAAISANSPGSLTLNVHGSARGSVGAGVADLFSSAVMGAVAADVRVTGAAAIGFGAANSLVVPKGPARRWLLRPCAATTPATWFMGAASVLGRVATIELVNPDATASQVDLNMFGPDGRIDAPNGHGIVVPGYASVRVALTALAPDVPLLAAEVVAVSGRVSASAYDLASNGLNSLGATTLPSTQAGLRLLIPAVPAGVSKATLQVITPANGGATVQVRLITSDGRFTPAGGGLLNLVANQVVSLDLTQGLAGQAAAILVTSSSPVVAGVRFQTATGKKSAVAVELAPATGLASQGILPGLVGKASVDVFLAAAGSGGQVSLSVWIAGSAPAAARQVYVPADRQLVVRLPAQVSWWSLVVTPVSGGALSITAIASYPVTPGPLVAAVPLVGLPTTLSLPAAHLDLGVATP